MARNSGTIAIGLAWLLASIRPPPSKIIMRGRGWEMLWTNQGMWRGGTFLECRTAIAVYRIFWTSPENLVSEYYDVRTNFQKHTYELVASNQLINRLFMTSGSWLMTHGGVGVGG